MERISTMPVHRPPPPEYVALQAALRSRRYGVWRERMVGVDDTASSPYHLRFVLAPADTPASEVLLRRRLAAMNPKGMLNHTGVCCCTGVV